MKITNNILIIFLLIFAVGCENNGIKIPNVFHQVKSHNYEEVSIPEFIELLIMNHWDEFIKIYSKEYNALCQDKKIDEKNDENQRKYYKLKILHELFTSKSAMNCSVGEIWNIPYMWHWVNENPRHEIYLKATNKLLTQIKPTREFGRYKSVADIDRTPYLFLSDLFTEGEKYMKKNCNSFSTFGWCSEREMAFVSLLQIMKITSKVRASNGHSWTEAIIDLEREDGGKSNFKIVVDNTFNKIEVDEINIRDVKNWKKDTGKSETQKWYNKKAKSEKEQKLIENFTVKKSVSKKLEKEVVEYLNERI